MDESLDAWFKREILAHEAALVRYLNRTWPNRDDVHDLRQEVYIRVYEAAARARPATSAKSFLFSTARHLMVDRVRHNRVISIEALEDLDDLNVLVDDYSVEQRVQARQELKLLAHAFTKLPARCREVVWMRRVDQVSQKEVAARLGITQSSVEKHIIKGTRFLANAVLGRNTLLGSQQDESQEQGEETSKGKPKHG